MRGPNDSRAERAVQDTITDSADAQIHFLSEYRRGPFDFWFEETSPLFDIVPIAAEKNTGRFEVSSHVSTAGIILNARYDAQSLRLTKRHSSHASDLIFVQRFARGGSIGRAGDIAFAHRPGDIAIVDHGHQFEGLHEASHLCGVYLKKESLGLAPEQPLPALHFPKGTLAARLIGRELDRVNAPFYLGQSQLNMTDFARFISCVRLAIIGPARDGDVRTRARRALRDLICEYIEKNLLNHELSMTDVLSEFGVSRATLYRMFESENGVRNYISNRRLFRAVFEISEQPARRGLIHETAERWGFSSNANFSRSVRRAFGTSPGQLCDRALSELEPTPFHPANSRTLRDLERIGRLDPIAA